MARDRLEVKGEPIFVIQNQRAKKLGIGVKYEWQKLKNLEIMPKEKHSPESKTPLH
jgi:hypothetical protein